MKDHMKQWIKTAFETHMDGLVLRRSKAQIKARMDLVLAYIAELEERCGESPNMESITKGDENGERTI